jgi:hypothetical protein
MADATITTYQRNLSNVSVASVPSTYATIAPTTTKPTSGVLVDHKTQTGNGAPSLIRATPYSSVTGGSSIGMRLVGWAIRVDSSTGNDTYVPFVLGDFTLTFATTPATWTIDGATQRPFSAVTQVTGTPAANLYSPGGGANTEAATVLVDLSGCQLVTAQFKSSGTPTMGVFYATL